MRHGRAPLLTGLLAAVALAAPAVAHAARPAGLPQPPQELPGDGPRAAGAGAPSTWLIGVRPGAGAARVARAHGASAVSAARGLYAVPRGRARALAGALRDRGLLRFSEGDATLRRHDAEDERTDWRRAMLPPGLAPPPVTPESPLIAILDSPADLTHPDLAGIRQSTGAAPFDFHGTAVASVAAAPRNGTGIVGMWPGARTLVIPTGDELGLTCGDAVRGLREALDAGARVINLSFGGPRPCFSMFVELSYAVSQGVVPVAAAGNERQERNPVEFPAAFPHVVSVAAYGPSGASSPFSTSNGAVDLTAPGESVIAAVPGGGYARLDGTSFAAPIVSAAVAWLQAARTDLESDQLVSLLRGTARDLGRSGWDPDSGYGVVRLSEALKAKAPVNDADEVNDDVEWVDGTRFTRADPSFWRGSGVKRTRARVDAWKDPADVYRVVVPARARVRALVRPAGRSTDPDLAVYDRRAETVFERRHRVGRSAKGAGRTESVRFTNRTKRARTFYVAVYAPDTDQTLNAAYRLEVQRVRR